VATVSSALTREKAREISGDKGTSTSSFCFARCFWNSNAHESRYLPSRKPRTHVHARARARAREPPIMHCLPYAAPIPRISAARAS